MSDTSQGPDRSDPSDERRDLEGTVARALRERARELAGRWRAELREHQPDPGRDRDPRDRPGPSVREAPAVYEGATLEAGERERMSDAVRWIVAVFGAAAERDPEAIRDLGRAWRDAGCTLDEVMLRLRILGRLLHDALREQMSVVEREIAPERVARLAEWLAHALDLATFGVLSGFRQVESDRFADFGNTLVHEIRNPLGGALAAAQSILILEGQEEPGVDERRERLLERLVHALEEANRILTSVSSLVRARSSPSEGEDEERRPLREVVGEVLADVRREEESEVDLRREGLPDIDVPAGPVRLALHNLVQNAVRYADPEKPDSWVRIECRRDDDRRCFRVRVEDNGVGIPREEQRLVFQRFWRGSDVGEGFGLGLSIVQEAVERLGGEIFLRSIPGLGTVFDFTVPFGRCGRVRRR